MKTGTLLAIVVFTVVALAHLYRLLTGAEVTINDDLIPQWISVPGVLVPGLIAWVLWKESK
jgi:Na+/H+ antiporter NhaA